MKPILLLTLLVSLSVLVNCENAMPKTKLIYFGFDDRSEKTQDTIQMARTWGENPPCPHWQTTITKDEAEYQVLFGDADVTVIDRQGRVLYSGGQGVLYMPHGNPDGSGINLCKLTGD